MHDGRTAVANHQLPTINYQLKDKWKPIGNRKAKVVLWGIVHNHARGKFDALLKLTNDYEIVGWVDDTASTAMRMQEPKPERYAKWPKIDGA